MRERHNFVTIAKPRQSIEGAVMIKKSVLSGALPLVLLAPAATVLSCATSAPQQKDDATVLAELKDRLNQTPPQ